MGLFAAVLCTVFSAAKDLLSKRFSFRMDGMTSTFASFAFALPFYVLLLAVLTFLGLETFTYSLEFWVLVLLRATTDSFAEGLKMHAFAHGDISLVATFFSMSPLFLLFLSPLITKDEVSLLDTLAVLLTVVGSLVLVYRPTSGSWRSQRRGILLALGAAVFFSLNTCFDRLAVQQGTPVFSGFTMTLISATFLAPFVLRRRDRVKTMRDHVGGLLSRGFLEIAFMVSKLSALQYLDGPEVVAIQRLALVWSIVGGRFFFKEQDFGRRFIAGLLIVLGVAFVMWRQWQRAHGAAE
jgi:drug/metabolite transporter (DMT)-like permease